MKQPEFRPHDYTLRPLADYCSRLPSRRPGKRIHRSTLWRWATKGTGEVVLQTMKLAEGRFTSDGWVNDFMRECTRRAQLTKDTTLPSPKTPSESILADFGVNSNGLKGEATGRSKKDYSETGRNGR